MTVQGLMLRYLDHRKRLGYIASMLGLDFNNGGQRKSSITQYGRTGLVIDYQTKPKLLNGRLLGSKSRVTDRAFPSTLE